MTTVRENAPTSEARQPHRTGPPDADDAGPHATEVTTMLIMEVNNVR